MLQLVKVSSGMLKFITINLFSCFYAIRRWSKSNIKYINYGGEWILCILYLECLKVLRHNLYSCQGRHIDIRILFSRTPNQPLHKCQWHQTVIYNFGKLQYWKFLIKSCVYEFVDGWLKEINISRNFASKKETCWIWLRNSWVSTPLFQYTMRRSCSNRERFNIYLTIANEIKINNKWRIINKFKEMDRRGKLASKNVLLV